MLKTLLSIVFILIFFKTAKAEVLINEFLPNPQGSDDGAEWVEIFNTGSTPFPLNNCKLFLHETETTTQKVVFGNEDFIEKYKIITWDGSWLNNNGDNVRFECESFKDSIIYGEIEGSTVQKASEGESIGRSPDGSSSFFLLSRVTMGTSNLPPNSPTEPPSSTPASKKSTSTPTKTPTPKSQHTSTPTTRKTTPTSRVLETLTQNTPTVSVLSVSVETLGYETPKAFKGNEENMQSEGVLGSKVQNKSYKVPIILTTLGLLFLGLSIFLFLLKKKAGYNL